MTYPAEVKVITLYTAIKDQQGNELTCLSMREPKVFDRLKFSYLTCSEDEKDLIMIADLCGQDVDVLKGLTIADYKQLEDQFVVFMVPPQKRAALLKKMGYQKEKSSGQ
ncbi:phage tail assembly protein [Buttiauxella sp. 3AFRM03]|uniref:phage tail assembly protein n=1 Tax=Buttiauxella sp. 3AFRM03 TaxID=2479367 RepID=UPI000EF84113|nr:phage tail assembly protein [Buttiauxella sp. 3AFRM03]AYN26403.1 phage tail assembly protein [Buttiauxella sp. 3AFRM03]